MPSLRIVLDVETDGFEAMRGQDRSQLIHLGNDAHIEIGCLANGMASGAPAAALCFKLPDGRVVLAETSLKLLLTAADTLKARYGDPRMADLSMPDITFPPDYPPLAMIRASRKLAEMARDSVSGEAFDRLGQVIKLLHVVEEAGPVSDHQSQGETP